MVCIRLCAPNDCNGNPRRVYVLLGSDGSIVRAVDEGYAGIHAIDGVVGKSGLKYTPVDIDTSYAEYRRLLRQYGK